jgi:magnesium transporter
VTADDIADVVEEEATEDIQMIGGTSALDDPYLEAGPAQMFRKRVVWLIVLFIGQTLTVSVVAGYQKQLEHAVILTLFMPLILSSGGNSGSQAATLVVRAIALNEVGVRDWLHVVKREALVGTSLGAVLGLLGLGLVLVQSAFQPLPVAGQLGAVALTIGISLVCVVLWGTIVGSMLPLLLRWLGMDPASASTPFVATCLDVSGLIIYFSIATALLTGSLL